MIVITGAVVSTTLTVLVAVAVLPLASVAVYVIVYVPTVSVSTEPDEDTVSPPSEVAPASVYVEPSSTVAGLSPSIVMIGKIVSGGVTVSSEILSATITPANMSSCSIIESSKRIVLAFTHFPSGL